jgi:hypothetical protein
LKKIAKNQSWKLDNNQRCQKIEEIPEEVCALTTKMDVLLDWLDQGDNYKRDHQAIQDAFNAQNRCGKYLGIEFSDNQEMQASSTILPHHESKDGVNRKNLPIKVST